MTLELAYRRQAGERPEPAEYQARFPGQDVVVRAAFEAITEISAGSMVQPGTAGQDETCGDASPRIPATDVERSVYRDRAGLEPDERRIGRAVDG